MTYIFTGATFQRRMPIMPGLAALINYNAAVLRINGEWVEAEFPSEQQINAADLYFPGGYENVVDDDTASLLTAAGYTVIDARPPAIFATVGAAVVGVSVIGLGPPTMSVTVGAAIVGVSTLA